jgi:hypothetical protein
MANNRKPNTPTFTARSSDPHILMLLESVQRDYARTDLLSPGQTAALEHMIERTRNGENASFTFDTPDWTIARGLRHFASTLQIRQNAPKKWIDECWQCGTAQKAWLVAHDIADPFRTVSRPTPPVQVPVERPRVKARPDLYSECSCRPGVTCSKCVERGAIEAEKRKAEVRIARDDEPLHPLPSKRQIAKAKAREEAAAKAPKVPLATVRLGDREIVLFPAPRPEDGDLVGRTIGELVVFADRLRRMPDENLAKLIGMEVESNLDALRRFGALQDGVALREQGKWAKDDGKVGTSFVVMGPRR